MSVKSTVATRLIEVIKRGRGYTKSYRQFLGNVYGINPNDLVAVSRCAISVQRLFNQTVTAVQNIDNINKELYLKPLSKLDRLGTTYNFDQLTNDMFKSLDDNVMNSLEMMVDVVNSNISTETIETEQATELKADTTALIKEVQESDINAKLKVRLLASLHEILFALDIYAINGAEALDEALERSIGVIVLSSSVSQQQQMTEIEKSTSKKVFGHIIKYSTLVGAANALTQIAEKAYNLLN